MLYYDSSKDKDPVTCQDHCYLGTKSSKPELLKRFNPENRTSLEHRSCQENDQEYLQKKKNSFLNNQPRINKLAFLSQGSSWELDLRSTLGKTHFTLMGKIHCLGPACPPEYITCTQISSLSLLMVVHL